MFLQQVHYWITCNNSETGRVFENRRWIYNSAKELCDKNNQIIKHCVAGDTLAIGANTKRIEVTNDDLENGKYYLKVYIDGKMITRREIIIN
ncbi:MAG: hypothetical protein JHD28_04910 [Bacteroidia bacterium]|nr:hypothetical protein [Bacteroidia bacterium]